MVSNSNYHGTLLGKMSEWFNLAELPHLACTEQGKPVHCKQCGFRGGLYWDQSEHIWYCPRCGTEFDREAFFKQIKANPPAEACVESCNENYPICCESCMMK